MQLEISALLQQDLAKVLGILPAPVPSEGLIIQNAVWGRPRKRSRGCLQRSRRQKQEHIDESYVNRGELIDWIVIVNSMANVLNQNRRENKQCIAGSGLLKKSCSR